MKYTKANDLTGPQFVHVQLFRQQSKKSDRMIFMHSLVNSNVWVAHDDPGVSSACIISSKLVVHKFPHFRSSISTEYRGREHLNVSGRNSICIVILVTDWLTDWLKIYRVNSLSSERRISFLPRDNQACTYSKTPVFHSVVIESREIVVTT